MKSKILNLTSVKDTVNFGQLIGCNLKGHETMEFVGDLGSGKTTLIKGIVKGALNKDIATSPSFSLINQYTGQKYIIYHADLYRLKPDQEIIEELKNILSNKKSVLLIEWPKTSEKIMPKDRIIIKIKANNLNERILNIEYPKELEYVFSDN